MYTKKTPRIVYSDYKSTFQELLDKDPSFSLHHINIQTLAIEIYKHIHGLLPALTGKVFKINRTLPYNLRTHNNFYSRVPKTVKHERKTISLTHTNYREMERQKNIFVWKLLILKSGYRNQIIHVGYAKPIGFLVGFL